jgi:hypothetical protein
VVINASMTTGTGSRGSGGRWETLKHGLWSAKVRRDRAVVTTALREARRLARDLAAD